MAGKRTIAFLTGAAGDWGGASRVVYTTLELLDRTRFEPLVMLPAAGPIEERLQALGIRYVVWGEVREPKGILGYARALASCVRFLHANRVDLLDINFRFWRPAEVLAARLLRIPVVTHYHLVAAEWGPFVAWSSAVVPVSRFTAEHSGPPGVPKVVIPNSIILGRFDRAQDVRNSLGISSEHVVFTFVGQIRDIKGADLFIKMARALPGDALRFLIVGECRDPAKYPGSYTEARLRAEIGDDPRILYLGYRTDVVDLFHSSDVIVAPSRWGEPLGLVNLAARAARKPMLAARDGGVPEVIVHGENGFLVERDDLDALIAYAARLAGDKALRAAMGARGRAIVEERFGTAPVRRLERLYEALIDRRFRPDDPRLAVEPLRT
jgi:glycosyltransferase involved in cell wall biosynthesis